jgi:hypothetical protein
VKLVHLVGFIIKKKHCVHLLVRTVTKWKSMSAGFDLSNQPKDFDCISFWHIHKSLVEFNIPLYYVCVIRSVQLNEITKRHTRVGSTSFCDR